MNVEFIHCTPDAERLIVKMARVSSPENDENWETGPRLLRYLVRKKHWSPFQMASLCLRITTERDIAAQLLRHSSFSFQELSTRYTQTTHAVAPALRRQDTTNRQSSHDDLPEDVSIAFTAQANVLIHNSYLVYQEMLAQGIAKETARRILPLCTPTTLYVHGTLRSWIHYLEVRCSIETQLEHRLVAEACRSIFMEQFPIISSAVFS